MPGNITLCYQKIKAIAYCNADLFGKIVAKLNFDFVLSCEIVGFIRNFEPQTDHFQTLREHKIQNEASGKRLHLLCRLGLCTENHLNCVLILLLLVAFIQVHHFLRAASSPACPYAKYQAEQNGINKAESSKE